MKGITFSTMTIIALWKISTAINLKFMMMKTPIELNVPNKYLIASCWKVYLARIFYTGIFLTQCRWTFCMEFVRAKSMFFTKILLIIKIYVYICS